jgi:hypothetical protein
MRGAAVREAIQDYEGAEQMLADALGTISRSDISARAAIAVSLARSSLRRGRTAEAARLLSQIEAQVPRYPPAIHLKHEMEKMK